MGKPEGKVGRKPRQFMDSSSDRDSEEESSDSNTNSPVNDFDAVPTEVAQSSLNTIDVSTLYGDSPSPNELAGVDKNTE